MQAAIDFGISNTDVVVRVDGQIRHWLQPTRAEPTPARVRELLAVDGILPRQLTALAVTGGHHRRLPSEIDGCPVMGVDELTAIARGGQYLAGQEPPQEKPILVVSAGSGVAMIAARGRAYRHVTGSGVGGGALLGLARLLIQTTDPAEIDGLATAGDPNAADLSLADVVSGPIGVLPPDTTAVNFGRIPRLEHPPGRADLAAALVTLVSQVIGTIAINGARAEQVEAIVVTGHLTDMASIRAGLARTGNFFAFPIQTPAAAGRATALGALLALDESARLPNPPNTP